MSRLLFGLIFHLLFVSPVLSAELRGRVVGVVDGDTIDVLTHDRQQVRIRLSGIDAPEKRQAFGTTSKQAMSTLVYARAVTVVWSKKDRYGRVIGKVLNENNADAGLALVKMGLAWHYKRYQSEQDKSDRGLYASAEDQARNSHLGLWRDSNPIAPWDFRSEKRH